MDFGTLFPLAVILVTRILVSRGIRVVQQAQTIVIERLGRYHGTLHSGINLILPILDKPRAIDWRFTQVTPAGEMFVRRYKTDKIDLREAVYDFPRQSVITKDKDRKSTRLNSSHTVISYAVFCLKKKKSQRSSPPGFRNVESNSAELLIGR